MILFNVISKLIEVCVIGSIATFVCDFCYSICVSMD